MGGPDLFGERGCPLLVGVLFEEIPGMGCKGGLKSRGRIRRFCPVRIEGSGGSSEEVIDVDADLGAVQRHRAAGGDQGALPCRLGLQHIADRGQQHGEPVAGHGRIRLRPQQLHQLITGGRPAPRNENLQQVADFFRLPCGMGNRDPVANHLEHAERLDGHRGRGTDQHA